jgi:hypothetical protein
MATETKMAIEGGRIYLPLAVGVDYGHPQWLDRFFLSSSFFFFFFSYCWKSCWRWAVGRSVKADGGLGWIAATPSVWVSLFFFLFFCLPKKSLEVGGGWQQVAVSRQVVLYLVA